MCGLLHPEQEWVELFRKPGNKSYSRMLAGFMMQNPERLADSLRFMQTEPAAVGNRIAWALTSVEESQPELLEPHLPELLQVLHRNPSWGVCRSLLLIIEKHNLRGHENLPLYDLCLNWLQSGKVPVGVRCNAMSVCYRLSLHIPELQGELMMVIQELMPYGSSGFRARAKKLLAAITKYSKE